MTRVVIISLSVRVQNQDVQLHPDREIWMWLIASRNHKNVEILGEKYDCEYDCLGERKFIHSFIHSFVRSFIHSSIYSFIQRIIGIICM